MDGGANDPVATTMPAAVGAAEEGLWLLQDLARGVGVSNLAMSLRLSYRVDGDTLRRCLEFLLQRHPVLSSSFPLVDGVIVRDDRRTWPAAALLKPFEAGDEDELRRQLVASAGEAFDLQSGPLIRLAHGHPSDGTTALALVVHHLIADGSTLRVLVEELLSCIVALRTSGELPALAAPAPHAPPAAAPNPESLSYWQEHVRGYQPAGAMLDAARATADLPSFRAHRVTRRLSAGTADAIRALRRRLRATDHIVLLSAYYVDLVRHGASLDLVMGMLTSTRGPTERQAVGFHVNTVPLRLAVDPSATFGDVVAATRTAMVGALPHIDVPYEALLRQKVTFAEPADWWRSRLFRHLFNFRLADSVDIDTRGQATVEEIHHGYGQHDLELNLERHGNDFIAKLVYGVDVHDQPFAEALLARYERIIETAHRCPDLPILDYDLRTREDLAIVAAANDTARVWQEPSGVLTQIVRRGDDAPEAVAVIEDGVTVTYRQLLAAAELTRRLLVQAGVSPGDVVALAARRTAGTAACVLGIWAAGAAYLPIDPAHPTHRLGFQLDELGCRTIVNAADFDAELTHGRAVVVSPEPARLTSAEPLETIPPPHDLAYVIYTSGSTGTPKGVRLTHRNLSNVVNHFRGLLRADQTARGLWLTTFSFDISALELLLPLVAGGAVVVAGDDIRATPEAVLALIERHGVDIIQATPTSWRLFGPAAAGRLTGTWVLCGGEPLSPDLARVLRATGAHVYNVYGPTETTIWSTVATVTEPTRQGVSIGRPLANTWVEVLDGRGRPVPPFIKGELCIGGTGVADGYWRRPQLTAEKFVTDDTLGRYYRTGDTASWTADGNLVLHGRSDRQVKIRAHRIELGEVEHAVSRHPHISGAAAIAHPADAPQALVVYAESTDARLTAEAVWQFATQQLPAYALPEHIVLVDRLPTTPNGKVDVVALSRRAGDDLDQPVRPDDAPPGDDTGRLDDLIQAWRSVLGKSDVDSRTHFFLSGGNSLMALKLIAEIERRVGRRIRLMTLLSAPTPARLAAALNRTDRQTAG
jgi:amino acid adenylation domain-containing protein